MKKIKWEKERYAKFWHLLCLKHCAASSLQENQPEGNQGGLAFKNCRAVRSRLKAAHLVLLYVTLQMNLKPKGKIIICYTKVPICLCYVTVTTVVAALQPRENFLSFALRGTPVLLSNLAGRTETTTCVPGHLKSLQAAASTQTSPEKSIYQRVIKAGIQTDVLNSA